MTKKINLQKKLNQLENLSTEFNDPESLDLEEAVDKYEQAAKLLKEIKTDLNKIELKINEIKEKYEE